MKAMAKSAHERDRVIAELKRDREHDRPRIQHLEAETMKLQRRLDEAKARMVDLENDVNNLGREVISQDKELVKEAARSADFKTRLGQAEKKIESLQDFSRDLAEQLSTTESNELALTRDLARERAGREAAERELDVPPQIAASFFIEEEQRLEERAAVAQGRIRC